MIMLSYWEGFWSAKFPSFIENIVMLIVVLSGFCAIHFTVTFSGTFAYASLYQEYRYIKDHYMGVPLYFVSGLQNYRLFYLQALWA